MNKAEREARRIEKEKDRDWSITIKQIAGWKCEICGKTFNLNSHHIIPRENREFRHDLRNGVCLCFNHHKFSLEISPHHNAFAFMLWLYNHRFDDYMYLAQKLNSGCRFTQKDIQITHGAIPDIQVPNGTTSIQVG